MKSFKQKGTEGSGPDVGLRGDSVAARTLEREDPGRLAQPRDVRLGSRDA